MTALTGCTSAQNDEVALKPRIVVLTDIGPADVEPDDNESAVRLMAYADRFEIEALITTIGWNCDPYPPEWAEYLHRVVDAYEQDVPNLMKRSAQDGFLPLEQEQGSQELGYWPSAGYLRSRTVYGSPKAGIGVIGEDNDTPGSELIIRLADEDDDRPIWVCVCSATAWYLFGNPHQTDTFEIGYLRGKRTPTVERGETDFNTLGLWFRVYFDVGVREQDHRGMVKSVGAANG